MVKNKLFLFVVVGMFLLSFTSAWGFQNKGTNYYTYNNYTINGSSAVHNDLTGLQGGGIAEYFHLPESIYDIVIAEASDWITLTEATAINSSMKNYVDYVNSTNGVGSGSYSDSWINSTIDSKINTNNASVNNWITNNNNSVNNYILFVNSTNGNSGVDTWVNNYSLYYTKTEVNNINTSQTNYNNQQNTSNNNYILVNNESVKNYINSQDTSLNTSNNNYILENNNSVKNYILYVNSTNGNGVYDDTWINSTIDSKILTQNSSVVNWVTSTFVQISNLVDLVGNWSAEKGNYYTKTEVNTINTSVTNTFNLYADLDILNNGTYLDTDTFKANYSQFLLNNVSITNTFGSYTLLSVLNNGSYFNTASSDSFVGNYSVFLTHVTSNTLNNGSYLNPSLTNYIQQSQLNNGTYFLTNNWNATNTSYMLGTNATIQNQSINNYITSVNTSIKNYADTQDTALNTSNNNYIAVVNTSQTNYNNAQNTSNNNYIASVNTSVTNALNTKLSLSGGTITGNISLGNNYLTNGTAGGGIIYHNGTGWIIRG